jgi:putative spermidine/putrescine transport system permease protein
MDRLFALRPNPGALLIYPLTAVVMLVILAPLLVPVAISVTDSIMVSFPPKGFTLRWYEKVLADDEFLAAVWVSLRLAVTVMAATLVLGVPCALGLTRFEFPGRGAVLTLVLSPLIFPLLVTGVALLQFVSQLGSKDSFLHLLLGHTAVCLPYMVRTVSGALLLANPSLEEAARTLGADALTAFRRITLPQIRSGVMAGSVFVFVTSFDDYTISMWLADAKNFTLPLQVYVFIERFFDPSVTAISALMILFSVLLLLLVERALGLKMHKIMGG